MPLVTPIQNWRTYVVHTQFLHGTVPPTAPGVVGESSLVDQRLSQTSRQVKWVDASVVTMQLVVLNAGLFARHRRGRPLGCPAGNDGPLAGVVGPTGNGGICRLPPVVAPIDPPDQPRLRRPCH